MPVTHHDAVELIPGDDWVIPGTLLDVNGAALDLTGATYEWVLIDDVGNTLTLSATVATVSAPQGTLRISVDAAQTKTLMPGRYADALRVSLSGVKQTEWVGSILVDANAFAAIDGGY